MLILTPINALKNSLNDRQGQPPQHQPVGFFYHVGVFCAAFT
jgi:hypothetical protein